jgi:hypothetical protein
VSGSSSQAIAGVSTLLHEAWSITTIPFHVVRSCKTFTQNAYSGQKATCQTIRLTTPFHCISHVSADATRERLLNYNVEDIDATSVALLWCTLGDCFPR